MNTQMESVMSLRYVMLVTLALAVGYGIILWIFRTGKRYWNLPPGPRTFPFIGSLFPINHLSIWNHKEKFSDISYVRTIGTDFVILNTVKAIRQAFQNPATAEVFAGRPETTFNKFFNQHGVIFQSINAENWKPLRQILHTLLKAYGDGIADKENVIGKELQVLTEQLTVFADNDEAFKLHDPLKASLANILTILVIGERFEYNDEKILANLEQTRLGNIYLAPVNNTLVLTFPFLRFLPFGPGSLHAPLEKLVKTNMNNLYHSFENLPQQELEKRKGIVFELMRKQKTTPWLSSSHIEGIMHNIMGAGTTTTYSSLLTFFLLMIYYPEIQIKIQQEICDVIGYDRYPFLADRANMPYTRAVILELTRYSSVVAMSVPHMCLKDVKFMGYTIPRGAVIIPNLFRVNHDNSIWDDPWEFKPSRFLDENDKLLESVHPKRQNLIPFGVGKRLCMGEVFAKSRIFLYITYILQKFSVVPAESVPSKDPRNFQPGIVIQPEEFKIKLKKIRLDLPACSSD